MSIDLETSTTNDCGVKAGHCSLAALVATIEAADEVPTLPEIFEWLEHATITAAELSEGVVISVISDPQAQNRVLEIYVH